MNRADRELIQRFTSCCRLVEGLPASGSSTSEEWPASSAVFKQCIRLCIEPGDPTPASKAVWRELVHTKKVPAAAGMQCSAPCATHARSRCAVIMLLLP